MTWLLMLSLLMSGCIGDRIEVDGAGATFPAPIYARWRALFQRENPGISIHYQAVGSGEGIKRITARRVHFGASDALLRPSEERALPAPLVSIPTVLGPVVIAYNLPQLQHELTLSGELLAAIYLGEIKRWDDPRISVINPGVDLPSISIRVSHRSDSSGTTHIFTDYLSSVSSQWRQQVGKGKVVFWPTGNDWAGEGNDGVAHRILLEPGGIGYLELKYAQNAGLKYAALLNREGVRVWPTVKAVQEAERNTPATPGTYLKASIVNAPGERSYPIAAYTYLLVYQDLRYMEPRKAHALLQFLHWVLTKGQTEAHKLHYVPLPEIQRHKALEELTGIKHHPLEIANKKTSKSEKS
jgi:phosphate transport system substrate-binding protein